MLGTCTWTGVYVAQVCFYTNVHIWEHTWWNLCTYVCIFHVCICRVCIWMRMCVYDITWHVEVLLLRFSICVYVRICMRMYMCAYVCVYGYMCICMFMYMCMSVYMYSYTFIYTRVWVYICTRVGASWFCLFVLSNLSTICARVSQVFLNTCMRGCGWIGSGVCFNLFMVSACCWCGSLCFVKGRDRGFILSISLFIRVLGWWVWVYLYTRVHTHKLRGYLMWDQVWDGHLES